MAKEKHGKDPGIKVVYLGGGAQANSLGGKLETCQHNAFVTETFAL